MKFVLLRHCLAAPYSGVTPKREPYQRKLWRVSGIYAAADIGSNTTHLLVGETDGHRVTRLENRSEWISLGEIVTREGRVPEAVIRQLVATMREFARIAREQKARRLYVFATEAMRAAQNHDEVVRTILEATGVQVEVISPSLEVELSYHGVQQDYRFSRHGDLFFELGGGSLQAAFCKEDRVESCHSWPLGTGRMRAKYGLISPCLPSAVELATDRIVESLEEYEAFWPSETACGSGGVIRGIWRALHPDLEKRIYREELDYLIWAATHLSQDDLVRRFGVKPKRAGTLLAGAVVFRAVMARFGFFEIFVSEYGIRDGAILSMGREDASTQDVS